MAILDSLLFFSDQTPRGGPEQMALDEALLEMADTPVLRTYRWSEPWISFGYSQSLAEISRAFPGTPLVRRWTGGGIVPHRGDWTFSLIVPRHASLAQLRPGESYCVIHRAVVSALDQIAVPAGLAPDPAPGPQAACFAGQPAQHDILAPDGGKVCGGAQRRVRAGFLHQGSVQGLNLPPAFGTSLAGILCADAKDYSASGELTARADILMKTKYSAPEWIARIP